MTISLREPELTFHEGPAVDCATEADEELGYGVEVCHGDPDVVEALNTRHPAILPAGAICLAPLALLLTAAVTFVMRARSVRTDGPAMVFPSSGCGSSRSALRTSAHATWPGSPDPRGCGRRREPHALGMTVKEKR